MNLSTLGFPGAFLCIYACQPYLHFLLCKSFQLFQQEWLCQPCPIQEEYFPWEGHLFPKSNSMKQKEIQGFTQ